MIIRDARSEDSETIVHYNAALAQETEAKALDLEILRRGVQALFQDEAKGRYFVAEQEGRLIGQLMITLEWSDWRNGWMWWIQSVYVAPDARRQGVFRGLFQHVQDLARQRPDVVGIRLYVEKENERAQGTYVSLGMHETEYLLFEQSPIDSTSQ